MTYFSRINAREACQDQKLISLKEVQVGNRVRLRDIDWEMEVEIVSKKPL